MRLIDADVLRDKLQKEIDRGKPPFDDVFGSIRCGVRLARNIVEDEPTVDAVPVRHGKWIHRGCGVFTCDKCSRDIGLNVYTTEKASERFKYCPNCGARMDEDETD